MGGVVGVRMIRELNGHSCIPMKDPLETKKMIATTRMFGKPVYELSDISSSCIYCGCSSSTIINNGY